MAKPSAPYPMSLTIDYPDRELNRLTTFFRLFTVIPIGIILHLLSGASYSWNASSGSGWFLLFLPLVLMLLFRQKYPRWWFDWNVALLKLGTRVWVYLAMLRDEYPSTDEEQAVHIDVPYPDAKADLSRWMPLVKWFLAIPHYIALLFLYIGTAVCIIIAWFAILFTGRYPRSLFDYVVGVQRWGLRVTVYMGLLTTDKYPPFSLKA